jgi:hypothetical protein
VHEALPGLGVGRSFQKGRRLTVGLASNALPTASGATSGATTVRTRTREQRLNRGTAHGQGILLEVVDGPMDGAFFSGDLERIRIGRVAGNDLELHADRTVSGRHATLDRTDDHNVWRLEDTGSANGTWIDDAVLSGARTIPVGSYFVVAQSVLRLMEGSCDESFVPTAEAIRSETARLAARFAPETAEGYGAAVALATAEQRAFLADRHFFFGLAVMNPESPILARGKGPISAQFLSEVLRRNDYWTGPRAWIERRLRTSALDVPTLFEDELAVTPRLLRLLLAADEEARKAGAESIRPVDVWRAFFTGPANRPRELLARGGIPPESVVPLIPAVPADEARPSAVDPQAVPVRLASAAPPPTQELSSGDPALDARAQESARRLYGVASLYHLAVAEDRHHAMKQLLVQEVAQVPAESRTRLLGQLQRLFPVVAVPALESSGGRPRERTDTQRGKAASEPPASERPTGPVPAFPWRALLTGAAEADLVGVNPGDRPAIALCADLFMFSAAMERFIASIVQDLRTPGLGTESLQLPGYRISIKGIAQDLAAGRELHQRAALQEYLGAVETWLIAIVAAYHEGPDLWFKDFWGKISPAAIESPLAEENKKKAFGLRPDFWTRYKEKVRTISLDLVSDEIRRRVSRRADEQFQLFFERRRPS